MPAPARIPYTGFEIEAHPTQLKTGEWTVEARIWRANVVKPFYASNTFKSREEAIAGCVEFGRRIIDGEIPGFSGTDLP